MAGRSMLDESYVVDDAPEAEEPEAPELEAAEVEPEPEAAAAPVTRTPITRRQRAKERDESILTELKATREAVSKQGETYRQELERISRENAELRGHVQGLANSRQAAPAERAAPADDPDKLLEEANRLLDAKDFSGYQRTFLKASAAAARAGMPVQQPQAQQQPGMNPMLQMVASQYIDVMSDRAALEIAKAHDRILEAQGVPESPERWNKAFTEGRRYMGGKAQKTPAFDQKSRGALAGVPTGRGAGGAAPSGGGEPGVTLTPLERSYAKKFKMTDEQYAKHLSAMKPERVER